MHEIHELLVSLLTGAGVDVYTFEGPVEPVPMFDKNNPVFTKSKDWLRIDHNQLTPNGIIDWLINNGGIKHLVINDIITEKETMPAGTWVSDFDTHSWTVVEWQLTEDAPAEYCITGSAELR